MLRPGPAVPIERPPTVEEVIYEFRARRYWIGATLAMGWRCRS